MIKAIKFASVPVRDQDQALGFYTECLGFKIVTDQPYGEGQRWIELGIPGAQTRLVLFTPDGHQERIGSMSNVTFLADDVRQTHAELEQRGVEFTSPPESTPWGAYTIFKDPDGNRFVLSSR